MSLRGPLHAVLGGDCTHISEYPVTNRLINNSDHRHKPSTKPRVLNGRVSSLQIPYTRQAP